MSLINKMLQDLDRRQALAGAGDAGVLEIRPTPTGKPDRHHVLWLVLAILLLIVLGWGGWMAMRLKFKPVVTPLAYEAASEAEKKPPVTVAPPQPPAPPAPQQAPVIEQSARPAPATPAPAPATVQASPVDSLKLALAIDSPPIEPAPKVETPKPEPKAAKAPKARESPVTVDKRDRTPADSSAAANEFRRAMTLVNQGRVAEAQQLLAAILKAEPAHANARQVYVAVLLEQGRIDQARRLLEEGLALAPSHAEFALALARILAGQREYEAALAVMDKADRAGAGSSIFLTLRGAVLQRLGRHAEAVQAYQNAVQAAPQQAANWLGLAISYEALARIAEARDAYRHSLEVGPLAPAAREYAETRIRTLQ